MNTYAIPPTTMHRSSSNGFKATTATNAEMRAGPRRIAELVIDRGEPSAAGGAMETRRGHSTAHWVAVIPGPSTARQAPAHVKALARELGVDTSVAWEALDGTYS